jgi:hypothetical protein
MDGTAHTGGTNGLANFIIPSIKLLSYSIPGGNNFENGNPVDPVWCYPVAFVLPNLSKVVGLHVDIET